MDIMRTYFPKVADSSHDFNIDLSSILSEYMERLKANYNNHESLLNFAHAAIFLQQWCDVYSRNVDYLYDNVQQLRASISSSCPAPQSEAQNHGSEANRNKHPNIRRRQILTSIPLEEFQLTPDDSNKAASRPRKRKGQKQNNIREAAFGRLIHINKDVNREHCMYDDDDRNGQNYFNIGRKDDFRLNWPVNQDFGLCEDIIDHGTKIRWSIYDDRVVSMPTPEYSDDGAMSNSAVPENNEANVSPSFPQDSLGLALPYPPTNPLEEDHITSFNDVHAAETEAFSINDGLNPQVNSDKMIEQPMNKCMYVFKLPLEVNNQLKAREKDGVRGLTAFLFSNVLKHSLKMKGVLPTFKDKKTDDRLVAQHVKNIMKKYNLENPLLCPQTLKEVQSDFLGFEPAVLPEVDDIFDGSDPDASIVEEVQLAHAAGDGGEHHDFQPVTPTASDHGDCYEDEVLRHMMEYQNNREIRVGNREGIAQWQASIESQLKHNINKRIFDVHEYGSDIIDCFNNVGDSISFAELVGQLCESEVCRYFVASLMLANAQNVHVEDEKQPDTLKLTLLCRERNVEFEEYLVGGVSPINSTPQLSQPRKKLSVSHEMRKRKSSRKQPSVSEGRHILEVPRESSIIQPNASTPVSSTPDFLLPCGFTSCEQASDVIDAGPSGLEQLLTGSLSSSNSDSFLPPIDTKRRRDCMDSESDEDSIRENYVKRKGYCKQQPGKGPWRNKSKKAR